MKKRMLPAFLLMAGLPIAAASQQPVTWRFDNLTRIGGATATIVGAPKLINTTLGKAIHFDGHGNIGDALFFATIPLTGAVPYTWEIVFRPASGGDVEQRFFHLQEAGSLARRLFELRVLDGKWCLDSFAGTDKVADPAHSAVILNCDAAHVFPLDRWYAVAVTYDGKTMRNYVDGVLQGEVSVDLKPLGKGGTSVGTRFNKRDFFSGDIYSARFTTRALPRSELLKVPSQKPSSHKAPAATSP